jgi:hypothetical protein
MITFPPFSSIEEAWLGTLGAAEQTRDGRLLHAVVAVPDPSAPRPEVVAAINSVLSARGSHSVDTVANTIFPANFYSPPDVDYAPELELRGLHLLDGAAEGLYATYREMLPAICTFNGNEHGTYFGRLVSWPGKTGDGYNQLKKRVEQLRGCRNRRNSAANAADLAIEGIAEMEAEQEVAAGLQVYKANDERLQAFPCLVHIDLSVVDYRLSLLAVYRHWHLVHKAYGNLIGLTRLLHFLSQQTGYEVGELMIHATVANAELSSFSHTALRGLISDSRAAMQEEGQS